MPKIYFISHAMPELVEDLPPSQWHLSGAGRRAAADMANGIADHYVTRLVTSTESKTIETAEIIAHRLDLTPEPIDGLREHRRDSVRLMENAEWQSRIREMFLNPHDQVLGDEPVADAHARFSQAMATLLADYPGEPIIVVTHGTVMSMYLSEIWGQNPMKIWMTLTLPHLIEVDRSLLPSG